LASNACVTEPRRNRVTLTIPATFGVPTVKWLLYWTTVGAEVIVGRAPLNRSGGEKTSALGKSGPKRPPPDTRTRPSGRSTDVEW
jgi:hypothetical protein